MTPLTMILIGIGALVLVLVAILLIRTFTFPIEAEPVVPLTLDDIEGESVAERIGLAVQFKTIAHADPADTNLAPFDGLHELLRTLYPAVFSQLKTEVINRRALLFTWEGRDPSLDGVAFAAHQDVVPANEAEDSGWTHPPFSGKLADDYVWGRGTLDCKGSLICTLEAVNNLLKSGYKPLRTVYLAFGDDEEVSGIEGARAIVETLQSRGVQLSFLLDEGGTVIRGAVPGIDEPVALIGISEKGYLSLKLKARVQGGHSSTPPKHTAIGSLSLAIAALEANPFPQRLEVIQFMMSFLGSGLPFIQRMAFANPWLFGGYLKKKLASDPVTNATTRTTAAPTIIKAGTADNVLPAEAEAVVNFRIMPGETVRSVFQDVADMIADDVVEILPVHGDTIEDDHAWDPTPVADVDSPQFQRLFDLVRAAFPGVLAAPYMMSGATDSRHYAPICQNAFRFTPFYLSSADTKTMHAINERLSVANAARGVAFYQECITTVSSLGADADTEELEAPTPVEPVRKAAKATGKRAPAAKRKGPSLDEPWESLPEEDAPLEVKPLKK